jgi:ABC-2 type transport system ATP-binding protein
MLNEKGKVAEHILRSDTRYHVKSMNKNGGNVDTEQAKEPSSAVRIAGLSKQFGNFTAVQNITLDIPQGQIFGFLGPNGSGKTTTIRMLCGLLLPSAGSGTVSGFDLRKQQRQIKAHIGYMSQKFSLYPDMTVEENLAFYAGVYGIPKDELEQRKRWVINMAGLDGHERELTRSLSGGWKQRLALGCAILHQPRVLFLDEPTSGVDPISRRAFWELIYELSAQGTTIFVTTHYMDEAEHCHALGLIYDGQLIATGSPSTLRSNMKAGEMLEITSDSPFTAIKSVQDLEGVLGVSLFGEKLHVFVEDAQKAIPNLDQALTVNGIVGQQIVPIPMTLEDLFLIYIEMSREGMQAGLIEKTIQRQPIGGPL